MLNNITRLSATFATRSGLTAAQVPGMIEVLSVEVLTLKGARAMTEKSKGRPKCELCGMRKVSGCTACCWYYCGECAEPKKKARP
jgi:hypothetical protein